MMGRSDMELSDMDSAIAALTTVAQRSSDGKFHFWLGRALDGARQQVPALDAYTRAIDDDVSWSLQNPTVYHERGKLFFQRGRTTAAYWDLRTALTLDPRRADTHWLLGQVFYEQRDYDTAITSYNRALALDPGRSSIEYQIGVCHLRAEPQRLPEAIAALERAREGGYGSVRADLFQRLAYAYRDLGQNGEAADNLERFLENATIPYDETLETQNEVRRLRGAR
jgi:tetratricopeptide (TPR) repeat protein